MFTNHSYFDCCDNLCKPLLTSHTVLLEAYFLISTMCRQKLKKKKMHSIDAELVGTECNDMKKEQKSESSLLLLSFCSFFFNIYHYFAAVNCDTMCSEKNDFGK